jgi:hypothetical protein
MSNPLLGMRLVTNTFGFAMISPKKHAVDSQQKSQMSLGFFYKHPVISVADSFHLPEIHLI